MVTYLNFYSTKLFTSELHYSFSKLHSYIYYRHRTKLIYIKLTYIEFNKSGMILLRENDKGKKGQGLLNQEIQEQNILGIETSIQPQ